MIILDIIWYSFFFLCAFAVLVMSVMLIGSLALGIFDLCEELHERLTTDD